MDWQKSPSGDWYMIANGVRLEVCYVTGVWGGKNYKWSLVHSPRKPGMMNGIDKGYCRLISEAKAAGISALKDWKNSADFSRKEPAPNPTE